MTEFQDEERPFVNYPKGKEDSERFIVILGIAFLIIGLIAACKEYF